MPMTQPSHRMSRTSSLAATDYILHRNESTSLLPFAPERRGGAPMQIHYDGDDWLDHGGNGDGEPQISPDGMTLYFDSSRSVPIDLNQVDVIVAESKLRLADYSKHVKGNRNAPFQRTTFIYIDLS
jgi:hypothetical protein